ncbi:hypothetical protein BJ912DRAFT_1146143 [Pholiota molesta]|nr:hypothetical protein BJ912DRAFT_1146143 [Pholiota molesta]
MKLFSFFPLVSVLLAAQAQCADLKEREALTCADPTTAVTAIQFYTPSQTNHMWDVVHANLVGGIALGGDYQYQGPLARMFPGPSNFTVLVYRLYSASLTDHVFLVSDDGAAPSLPGYTVDGVIAYVYPTQICGSTPLYAVYSASLGDHWYTISTVDRARMLQLGWVDAGVQGYVLPLDCGCST